MIISNLLWANDFGHPEERMLTVSWEEVEFRVCYHYSSLEGLGIGFEEEVGIT